VAYIREDNADIRVSLAGVAYGDSWKEVEGGNLTADDVKTRPGGMGYEVSAGGPASREDLTVRTQFTDVVATWVPIHEALVGNGVGIVGVTWLGPDKIPTGMTRTRKGTLKAVNPPDMGGGNDVGLYELVFSMNELAA
jgi:hypothetical protein